MIFEMAPGQRLLTTVAKGVPPTKSEAAVAESKDGATEHRQHFRAPRACIFPRKPAGANSLKFPRLPGTE
jgi:hypothetical protein